MRTVQIVITTKYDDKVSTHTLDLRGKRKNADLLANKLFRYKLGFLPDSELVGSILQVQMTASLFRRSDIQKVLAVRKGKHNHLYYDVKLYTESNYPDKTFLQLQLELSNITEINTHIMNATHNPDAMIDLT